MGLHLVSDGNLECCLLFFLMVRLVVLQDMASASWDIPEIHKRHKQTFCFEQAMSSQSILDQFQKPIPSTLCFSAILLKKLSYQHFVMISCFHFLRSEMFFLIRGQARLSLHKSSRQMDTKERSGQGVTLITNLNLVSKVKTDRAIKSTKQARLLVSCIVSP